MDGIRQVLCVMTLLAYNLIVCYVLSHQEGDIEFCDQVLNHQLKVRFNIIDEMIAIIESNLFYSLFRSIQRECGFYSSRDVSNL